MAVESGHDGVGENRQFIFHDSVNEMKDLRGRYIRVERTWGKAGSPGCVFAVRADTAFKHWWRSTILGKKDYVEGAGIERFLKDMVHSAEFDDSSVQKVGQLALNNLIKKSLPSKKETFLIPLSDVKQSIVQYFAKIYIKSDDTLLKSLASQALAIQNEPIKAAQFFDKLQELHLDKGYVDRQFISQKIIESLLNENSIKLSDIENEVIQEVKSMIWDSCDQKLKLNPLVQALLANTSHKTASDKVDRLLEYGIDPQKGEISDTKRFAHQLAIDLAGEKYVRGHTEIINSFMAEVEEKCHGMIKNPRLSGKSVPDMRQLWDPDIYPTFMEKHPSFREAIAKYSNPQQEMKRLAALYANSPDEILKSLGQVAQSCAENRNFAEDFLIVLRKLHLNEGKVDIEFLVQALADRCLSHAQVSDEEKSALSKGLQSYIKNEFIKDESRKREFIDILYIIYSECWLESKDDIMEEIIRSALPNAIKEVFDDCLTVYKAEGITAQFLQLGTTLQKLFDRADEEVQKKMLKAFFDLAKDDSRPNILFELPFLRTKLEQVCKKRFISENLDFLKEYSNYIKSPTKEQCDAIIDKFINPKSTSAINMPTQQTTYDKLQNLSLNYDANKEEILKELKQIFSGIYLLLSQNILP